MERRSPTRLDSDVNRSARREQRNLFWSPLSLFPPVKNQSNSVFPNSGLWRTLARSRNRSERNGGLPWRAEVQRRRRPASVPERNQNDQKTNLTKIISRRFGCHEKTSYLPGHFGCKLSFRRGRSGLPAGNGGFFRATRAKIRVVCFRSCAPGNFARPRPSAPPETPGCAPASSHHHAFQRHGDRTAGGCISGSRRHRRQETRGCPARCACNCSRIGYIVVMELQTSGKRPSRRVDRGDKPCGRLRAHIAAALAARGGR